MNQKKEIRKRVLALRDTLMQDARLRSEILMTEKILGHQWYYGANEILLFASCGSEISTAEIMADAFKKGKKVYLPRVCGENMEFYPVEEGEALEKGYHGISEPSVAGKAAFSYSEKKQDSVLMLMPGAAFDVRRNRIGYGKGFYDRYLADKEGMHTIAIGFACQMVPEIEAEENDVKPMQVICL